MNGQIELLIEDISTEGAGIGKADGVVVFVPDTLPGDRVLAEITEDKGRFLKAKLLELIEGSPDRIEPACRYTKECGGCPLMSYSYDKQLQWKERHVRDCLTRIAKIADPAVRPILSAGKTLRYRNKAEFALQGNKAGYFARGSHKLIEVEDCPIQPENIVQAMKEEAASMKPTQKYFVRMVVRTSSSGEIMIIKQNLESEGTASCRVLHDKIVTDAGELMTEVSPLSFYQVNPEGCSLLYSKVQEYAALTGTERVLDLYCGAGSIGLSMAAQASRVIGVESVKPAVIDANRNAVINGIVNATFICGKAEDVIDTKLQGVKADLVIVDPPRSGCAKSLLEAIKRIAPEKLIYVSCDPSTLARDLKILTAESDEQDKASFRFVEATPVDMFPNTAHCEVVSLLSRI